MNNSLFIEKAKQLVSEQVSLANYEGIEWPKFEMYVVWSVKVLQNSKCLIANSIDSDYYEVTYNGGKKQIYVDRYSKISNSMHQP